MTSKEFVISRLKVLSIAMPQLSIKYSYDQDDLMHCVEIKPKAIFDDSPEYLNFEEDLYLSFIDSFPEQSLYFITEGALSPITCADYETDNGDYNVIGNASSFRLTDAIMSIESEESTITLINENVSSLLASVKPSIPVEAGEENYALAA